VIEDGRTIRRDDRSACDMTGFVLAFPAEVRSLEAVRLWTLGPTLSICDRVQCGW